MCVQCANDISFRFKEFFGLRDFIHMIHYLHREKSSSITPQQNRRRESSITPQLVMAALERNFNGCDAFDAICKEFLKHVSLLDSQMCAGHHFMYARLFYVRTCIVKSFLNAWYSNSVICFSNSSQ